MKTYLLLTITLLLCSCVTNEVTDSIPEKENSNLKYFGWTLIDTYWDDPKDDEEKTNYIDEIANFSNIADILPADITDDIRERIGVFQAYDVEVVLHVWTIFFEESEKGGDLSGTIFTLREDYEERWNQFSELNEINVLGNNIHCFYLGEEPAWNGITEEEFTEAADFLKEKHPEIPILSVEAYAAIDLMYAPDAVDYIGWDRYFVKEPSTNENFLGDITVIQNLRKDHQKIYLIMDAHHIPVLHNFYGISKKQLGNIARSYYDIANSNENIQGILGYHWPSGFDIKSTTGARDLPEYVQSQYESIGKTITEK